jgi:hypothetical protein
VELPKTQISSKVKNSAIVSAIVTLIIGIATDTNLAQTQFGQALSNPATVGAIITIVSVVTGYSTEETAFQADQSDR